MGMATWTSELIFQKQVFRGGGGEEPLQEWPHGPPSLYKKTKGSNEKQTVGMATQTSELMLGRGHCLVGSGSLVGRVRVVFCEFVDMLGCVWECFGPVS